MEGNRAGFRRVVEPDVRSPGDNARDQTDCVVPRSPFGGPLEYGNLEHLVQECRPCRGFLCTACSVKKHPRKLADYLCLAYGPLSDQPKFLDRKSTRLNSSHPSISYAVFCLKKKTTQ